MSAQIYLDRIQEIVARIRETQAEKIREAGARMAQAIAGQGRVYLFGSGHSVIPVLDVFPRYGSFTGFFPIMDPRLMWFNVVGPGGARELLWLEREPGYIKNVLLSHHLDAQDTLLVFSHGGMNAAGIEIALAAKEAGLTVVGIASVDNRKINQSKHPSGKALQ